MNFKDDVEFYLKKNNKFDYYGFDIANDSIAEEDEETEGGDSESGSEEASVKTKKKCSCCGKDPCECNASKRTGTHGEEDDDGWHASTNTPPADFGATPEEIEMLKLIKKNGGLGGKFVAETPEEKKMLELAMKIAGKTKASVKDDHTAGFAPAVKTDKSLKEEILKNL